MEIKENDLYTNCEAWPEYYALVISTYDDKVKFLYINCSNESYININIVNRDIEFFKFSTNDFFLSKTVHKKLINAIFKYNSIRILKQNN